MEKKEKKVDKEQAKKSDDDDDYEWSEPLHQDSANGGAKANETNGAADGAADGAANGSRVDFAGRLIDATGKSTGSSASQVSEFESLSDDLFEPIPHDPMYPNHSSKHLTASYSKQDVNGEEGVSFLKDDPKEMTIARRIALGLLDRKWYNPNAGKPTIDVQASFHGSVIRLAPSLKRAWAYFEHVTLVRYFITGENRNAFEMSLWGRFRYASTHADEEFENAMPGEKRRATRLYDYLATPHMQLGDFGLGFGLYFSTLRAISYILFIAGMISVFNIYFFASGRYSNLDFEYSGLENLLRGSAVCTDTEWVPCIDCSCNDTIQGWERTSRCEEGNSTDGTDGGAITFIVKNRCLENPGDIYKLGLVNYGVMMFLLPTIYFWLGWYLNKHAVKFDEDEQSAQDYSIIIKHPPPDATNPRKWRKYFESTFPGVEVIAVTCNVNNDLLVKALVKRREVLRRMEVYLDSGTDMDIDNLALLAAMEAKNRSKYFGAMKAFFVPGLPELISILVSLNTRAKGLAQLDYPSTNIFVTFEKESHQRQVLSKLSVGKRYIKKNDPRGLEHPKYLFEGTVLNACEATEPTSIRWEDLNVRATEKLKQLTFTTILTVGAILVCALGVREAEKVSPGFGAAFTISIFNLSFPQLAKYITDFEGHRNESKLQTSLYIKIAAFRWVNTSIVTTVITPFTNTLSPRPGLISQIAAIFFAEIVTTNVIQLTDIWGHIQRHFLAPRAKTQDAMNRCFRGLEVELAERYTNMTKIMFLAFWYSAIFPGGLLLASVALTVNYYTDRFSLMRSWQRAPRVGTEISNISLNYFFSTSLFFLASMSSFYWSAFPFDNLCPTDNALTAAQNGTYTIESENGSENVTVDGTSDTYRFCNQDFILRPGGPDFPFIYREDVEGFGEWMSDEQKFLSKLFGWTSVGFIALVSLKFLYGIYLRIKHEFISDFDATGNEQGIAFHEVATIAGYVPQVRSTFFSFPLIVCDCDKLGDRLFDWTDPDQDYGYYDLTKDADHILTGSNRRAKNSFDRVKYWPPKTLKRNFITKKGMQDRRVSSVFNTTGSLGGPQ